MKRIKTIDYCHLMVEMYGADVNVFISASEVIDLFDTIDNLRIEIDALKAIIDADRMTVVGECTCLPLDGVLGSTTCQSCRDNAEYREHIQSNFGSREWFEQIKEIEF